MLESIAIGLFAVLCGALTGFGFNWTSEIGVLYSSRVTENPLIMPFGAMCVCFFVGALVVGLLVGLIPFFQAKKRDLKTTGIISLVCCALGSFYIGIFAAILICIIFIIIIRVIYSRNMKKQA